MILEVLYVLTLVGSIYLSWKRKMIDLHLWRLAKGEQMKTTNANELEIWEDRCDQVRGLIVKTVLDS